MQGGLNPQSCAALWAAGGSMESNAFYSVRGLLWKVPRRRREEGAGRIESAIMRRPVGAENPMGSGAFFIVHGASIEISAR